MKRPTTDGHYGSLVTTPRTATMMRLLGTGASSGAVTVSRDEFAAIKRLYGYKPEGPNPKPSPPDPAAFKDAMKYEQALRAYTTWKDPQPLMQAGADRNAFRDAEADGMRLLAWIAKYVPKGEDPLKTLIQFACEAGVDVDPEDVGWADVDAE